METVIRGVAASKGTVTGTLRRVEAASDGKNVAAGDIILSTMTRPDLVPIMHRCGGVITQQGGVTCHAAIVCREMRKPAVVGLGEKFSDLQDGMVVTIDGAAGIITIHEAASEAEFYAKAAPKVVSKAAMFHGS